MKMSKVFKILAVVMAAAFITIIAVLWDWVQYKPIDFMEYYFNNKQALTQYAEKFLDQPNIGNVTRYKSFLGIDYGIKANSMVDNEADKYISFIVPYNEEPFWDRGDVTKISAYHAKEKTLTGFLQRYGISVEEYLEWRAVLAKYNLTCITLSDGPLVDLSVAPDRGFLYRRDPGVSFGYGPKYLQPINKNWAYYDERGIDADSTD